MSGFTLKSNHILTEQGFRAGYLTVEDGKIVSVSSRYEGACEDLGDLSVYPGIIDIHNHGFGGWSMTDPCTCILSVRKNTFCVIARSEFF